MNKYNRYTVKDLITISKRFKTKMEFFHSSPQAYEQSRVKGVLDKVCKNMPKTICKNPNRFWTNKKKKVMCVETKEVFYSINSAAKKLNLAQSNISASLNGRPYRHSVGGKTFKFI